MLEMQSAALMKVAPVVPPTGVCSVHRGRGVGKCSIMHVTLSLRLDIGHGDRSFSDSGRYRSVLLQGRERLLLFRVAEVGLYLGVGGGAEM